MARQGLAGRCSRRKIRTDDRPRYFCPGPEGPARQRPASPQVNPKREDLSQFMAIFRIGN
jgi:hypothetical protein